MDERRAAREVPAPNQGVQKIRQSTRRAIPSASRKLSEFFGLPVALGPGPERDEGHQRPVRGVPANAT